MSPFACERKKKREELSKSLNTYFEANEEGERHGDQDEQPAEDCQDPSANSDSRVAVVSCFFLLKTKKKREGKRSKQTNSPLQTRNTPIAKNNQGLCDSRFLFVSLLVSQYTRPSGYTTALLLANRNKTLRHKLQCMGQILLLLLFCLFVFCLSADGRAAKTAKLCLWPVPTCCTCGRPWNGCRAAQLDTELAVWKFSVRMAVRVAHPQRIYQLTVGTKPGEEESGLLC